MAASSEQPVARRFTVQMLRREGEGQIEVEATDLPELMEKARQALQDEYGYRVVRWYRFTGADSRNLDQKMEVRVEDPKFNAAIFLHILNYAGSTLFAWDKPQSPSLHGGVRPEDRVRLKEKGDLVKEKGMAKVCTEGTTTSVKDAHPPAAGNLSPEALKSVIVPADSDSDDDWDEDDESPSDLGWQAEFDKILQQDEARMGVAAPAGMDDSPLNRPDPPDPKLGTITYYHKGEQDCALCTAFHTSRGKLLYGGNHYTGIQDWLRRAFEVKI